MFGTVDVHRKIQNVVEDSGDTTQSKLLPFLGGYLGCWLWWLSSLG